MKKSEFIELVKFYRINIGPNSSGKLALLLKMARDLNNKTKNLLDAVEKDIEKYKKNTKNE